MKSTPTASQRYECDVVVIEDFRDLAFTIAQVLQRSGLSVQVALDGRTALEIARKCVAKVALIDCTLPDYDGLDLVPWLRRYWPHTEIILVSGEIGGVSASMARSLGIRTFLNKPVPLRALCQAVQRLVASPAGPPGTAQQSWVTLGIGSPGEDTGRLPLAARR